MEKVLIPSHKLIGCHHAVVYLLANLETDEPSKCPTSLLCLGTYASPCMRLLLHYVQERALEQALKAPW